MLALVVLSLFCASVLSRPDKRDLTLTDKAVGEDVVDAVLWKISQAKIFLDDYCYMKRQAYGVTKFGEDPATFADKSNKNIWDLGNVWFPGQLQVDKYHDLIYGKLNINWKQLKEVDMLKPMISALGTYAYTDFNNITIPSEIDKQDLLYDYFRFDVRDADKEMKERGIKCLSDYQVETINLDQKEHKFLSKNEKAFLCHSLPADGISVSVNCTQGLVNIYYSFSYSYPSPALSDGLIDTTNELISNPSADRVCFAVKGFNDNNEFTITFNSNDHGSNSSPSPS